MIYEEKIFKGGIAEGSKIGYDGSFQDAINLDYKSDPDRITLNKRLIKQSGNNVTDWIQWFVEYNSDIFGYGDAGKIYKITSAGVYSNPKTVSDSVGNGMAVFNDELWYASNKGIGRTSGLAGGSPTFLDDYFKSLTNNIENSNVASGQTYTTPTTITENDNTHKYTWTASASGPVVIGIMLYIVAKGTGTVTVTLHDNSNNLVASTSLSTGSITASKFHYFAFSGVKLVAGASYHYHVTSTVADTTVRTGTASNLSTAESTVLKYYNDFDRDQSRTQTSALKLEDVTIPTTLTENSSNYITFTPIYRELAAVSLWVGSASAGTWTITIHDAEHNVIGSMTTTTVTVRGFNRFEFTTPLNLIPGETYHIHFTCSASNVIFASSTTLSTGAYFITHFQVLQNVSNHMMLEFGNLLCVANGRYLLTIDDSEVIEPHALVLPKGESIRVLEVVGDQLMITPQRGSNIGDYNDGFVYIWDGDQPFYTGYLPVNGQVQAMKHDNNTILLLHGPQIRISRYTGAVSPLRKLKNMKNNIKANVIPGSISASDGLVYFGLSGANSDDIDSVIYSYGRKDKDYPNSLNKEYVISTGNKNQNVHIGAIKALSAGRFYVAWKDTNSNPDQYGVDIIDTSNDYASGYITFLRFDGKDPNRLKAPTTVSIVYMPLTEDQKITIQARKNQKGAWFDVGVIDPSTDDTLVDTVYRSFSFVQRFLEIEFKIILETTSGVAPTVLSFGMEFQVEKNFQMNKIS